MNVSTTRPSLSLFKNLPRLKIRSGMVYGGIIIGALIAFELFNYSTTDYALRDLLGNLRVFGIPWATILTIAFCGIDFAGIARLFSPHQGADDTQGTWYLFGAWLLAATMNAILTWWGISMAIANHAVKSTAVVSATTLTRVVPVFVALMVWVIRILVIGTLTTKGDRLLSGNGRRTIPVSAPTRINRPVSSMPISAHPAAPRPMVRPTYSVNASSVRPEPTYHSMNSRPSSPVGSAESSTVPTSKSM
jgi:hypothetical protein